MVAITGTHLTTANSDSSATSFTSASITPTPNRLVMIGIWSTVAAGNPNIPIITGANMRWDFVNYIFNPSGTTRLSIFRGVSINSGTGALTFDFAGQTNTKCYHTISEFANCDMTGNNGANAIIQFASASNPSSTTSTATLGAFSHPNNGVFEAGRAAGLGTGYAAGSGFTSLGSSQNSSFIQSEWRADNDTSVDWSQTAGATDMLTVCVELKVAQQDIRDYRRVREHRDRFAGEIGRGSGLLSANK